MAILWLKHNGERFIIYDEDKLTVYPRSDGVKRLMVAPNYPPQEVIDKLKESTYREVQQILSLYI